MKRIYCIRDLIAQTIVGQLVMESHDAPITRMFHDLCRNRETIVGQHPADFILVMLGTIDEDGRIIANDPVTVARGDDWVALHESLTLITQEK